MTTTTGGDRTRAGGTEPARVRRATGDDIAALVRLRARMLADMGVDVGDEEAVWRSHAADWFAARIDRDDAFAAFVVDDPELGVVACAVGRATRTPRVRTVRAGCAAMSPTCAPIPAGAGGDTPAPVWTRCSPGSGTRPRSPWWA